MKPINVLSLCDGISCGQLALERAYIPVNKYYSSEIDKHAIAITQYNFPNTIQLGDITKCDFKSLKNIDLIIGGTPCQNLSVAGDRKGLNGDQSKLFYAYIEALKIIKPKYFLFENVNSMSQSNKNIITECLKNIYADTQVTMINSALLSAQQRKRLYWTNFPVTQPKDKGILLQDVIDTGCAYNDKAYCITARYGAAYFEHDFIKKKKSMIAEPVKVGQFGTGGQGDRVYSVKGKSIALTANSGGKGSRTGLYKIDLPDGEYVIRKLTPIEAERCQTLPDDYTAFGNYNCIPKKVAMTNRYKAIGNGWTIDVISHILNCMKEELCRTGICLEQKN